MKGLFRIGTLGSRIYTVFIVFIFGTIFIMQIVSFQFTVTTVRNSMIASNRTLLSQLTRQIDSYIEDMENLSLAIIEESGSQDVLRSEYAVSLNDHRALIQEQIGRYLKARDDILNIYFTDLSGTIFSADAAVQINPWSDVTESPWFVSALENPDRTIISGSYVQNLIVGEYSWVTSLSRGILSSDTEEPLGVLLVDLKFDSIQELCQSMVTGRRGYNFILDENGDYVYHPTQQLVYSGVKDEPVQQLLEIAQQDEQNMFTDGQHYYFVNTSSMTGWHVVSVLFRDDMITDWTYVQITYAAIGLILFLIVGLATNRITRGITSPVKRLQGIMKSVDTGDFHLVGQIDATDEIRELAHDYDIMVTRIRELMVENVKEQELKRKSDLKALQAQINPHFLYNTLDSIIWMGEMRQHKEVVLMTSALSKLMRISISKGRELISVRDEIDHVRSYLTIEEMRYRNKYDSHIDIDPAIGDEYILKITLQPLVENAIYHGIKEVDHKGLIEITGRREAKVLIFTVSDNGRGMSPETVEKLNTLREEPDDEADRASGQGMGVRNVHARIRLYFGESYGLHCESTPGVGTTITVRIPSSEAIR